MFQFTTPPALSLYLHIPWCIRKCPYCDFNSHEARGPLPEDGYLAALLADLDQDLAAVKGRSVETVFLGGGTPSLFSPDTIDRLLGAIRARLTLRPDAEITLEANPGTVDQERFRGFREAGVNRLSLGIQSFQPQLLKNIGRIHDRRQAMTAIEAACGAGFQNLNLDLMFGLPQQTTEQALSDLCTALEYQPAHISWYELTIEPNTWFHHHPPTCPDDDTLWTMQQAGREVLSEAGYHRYEVSAWAHTGRQCRHNLNYWRYGDYLGIGAGAHGKLSDTVRQSITRISKTRHPHAYLENAHSHLRIATRTGLTVEDAVLEFAMNALRLEQGFSAASFSGATGLPFSLMQEPLMTAMAQGLLVNDQGRFHTTAEGQRYLNEVLQLWITDSPHAA
ncbi:MAG: radical SAM family heme chaperone HemW [Gammaproteobacteria bacterium]